MRASAAMRNVCRRLQHAELAHLGEVSHAGRLGTARAKSAFWTFNSIWSRRLAASDEAGLPPGHLAGGGLRGRHGGGRGGPSAGRPPVSFGPPAPRAPATRGMDAFSRPPPTPP